MNTELFFNDTATTEIYTLSLHDALPIYWGSAESKKQLVQVAEAFEMAHELGLVTILWGYTRNSGLKVDGVDYQDRKSTRLNSSQANISYAVFCLKKRSDGPNRDSRHPRT